MKIEPVKTVYYKDEQNDEFSTAKIEAKKITKDYQYTPKGILWKIKRFTAYRLIATPIALLYSKLFMRQKVKNKRILKSVKGTGFFLFINHTQAVGDAFMPHVAIFPRSAYTVVHPNNVSMPLLGRFTPLLGALPIPDSVSALKQFSKAVKQRYNEKRAIIIYPEAHIWPYCTRIRNFPSTAMKYPVELGAPSFTMTNVYKKSKWRKKPYVISYIDGPFYPDTSLSQREAREVLKEKLFEKMTERSRESDCEYIRYVKEG